MSDAARSRKPSLDTQGAVIPAETWFFRYPESFEHLRQCAEALRGTTPLRIASLGCASGAEAFSIAAALEGDVEVEIVAIDRSSVELDIGRSGRLRPITVRGSAPTWAVSPWTIEDGAVIVRPELRACVRFVESDVLDESMAGALGVFDIVFCRNVLIYLDEEDRLRLGRTIVALLKPGGWLFLGHADRPSTLGLPWRGRSTAAFAFRRPTASRAAAGAHDQTNALGNGSPDASASVSGSPSTTPRSNRPAARAATIRTTPPAVKVTIDEIRSLADAGHAQRALDAARHMHAAGQRSAELFEMLGTLELAAGRIDDAKRHLRAALYLDPGRDDAALQLRLLEVHHRHARALKTRSAQGPRHD